MVDSTMEVDSTIDDSGPGTVETHVAIHPLAIVHMSDQYTRISSGGSPLEKTAPVVGLLFGFSEDRTANNKTESPSIEVLDADDIPVEVSETSKLQVDLHKAVFPKHKVVGWYRVASQVQNEDIEPTREDLDTTKLLKAHYAPSEAEEFCFCLLKVQQSENQNGENTVDDAMKTEESPSATDTLSKELPINLYELHKVNDVPVLIGLSNWYLDTAPAERISVERVMKEGEKCHDSASHVPFVNETKTMGHSLNSMKDRVNVLIEYLKLVQDGKQPVDYGKLRQIQQIVTSMGPLSSLVNGGKEGEEEDAQILSQLAIIARSIHSMQSYSEKFRVLNESKMERQNPSFSSWNY